MILCLAGACSFNTFPTACAVDAFCRRFAAILGLASHPFGRARTPGLHCPLKNLMIVIKLMSITIQYLIEGNKYRDLRQATS